MMLSKTISHAAAKGNAVRSLFFALVVISVFTVAALGQTYSNQPTSADTLEFPVKMQQKVAAGKTPAGTKVHAKLAVATLVQGLVIPQDAVFTGEVTESAAKSGSEPSRLAIRMDSAQWKSGPQPTVLPLTPKVYLTAWFYPLATVPNNEGTPQARTRNWGTGTGSGQRSSPPLSGSDPGSEGDRFPTASSDLSNHRVLMKNINSTRNSDGAITLTSHHSNIKLDKSTAYVLAVTDLRSSK